MTSPQGAVVRDIIRIAHRRFPLPIVVSPAPVQGEGAALAIASALRRLEALPDVDVIIVARGGGSLEDLWAFNEEPVARAIFACRVPVISAVGHETDFTIADFVADLRAPTPSAAAEQAVPVLDDVRLDLVNLRRRASRAASESLRAARHGLERARNRLGDPRRLLDERRQRMDDSVERARRVLARRMAAARTELRAAETRLYRAHPHRRIGEQRGELAAMRHRLEAAIRPALARRRHAVDAACGKLGALSPTQVLERGFSLTQRADGHIVTRAADLAPGERVHVRVREGAFDATVAGPRDQRAGTEAATKATSTKGSKKGRRPMIRAAVLGGGRQQEPLARHPQRRLPRAGDRGAVRGDQRRRGQDSTRWRAGCARRGTGTSTSRSRTRRRPPLWRTRRARGARVGRRQHAAVRRSRVDRARREHRRRRVDRRARRSERAGRRPGGGWSWSARVARRPAPSRR